MPQVPQSLPGTVAGATWLPHEGGWCPGAKLGHPDSTSACLLVPCAT